MKDRPACQAPQSTLAACEDYTAIQRRPNNEWTANQRVILAWLASSYENNWNQISKIFNAYFREELKAQQGLSEGAISTMWYCMKLRRDEVAAVTALQTTSSSCNSVNFEALARASVQNITSDLGIELIEKQPGSLLRTTKSNKPTKRLLKKRKAGFPKDSASDESSTVSLSTIRNWKDIHTPRKRHKSTDHSIGLLSPPSTNRTYRVIEDPASSTALADSPASPSPLGFKAVRIPAGDIPTIKQKKLPRLAFRAWTPSSMGINSPHLFVAGSFQSVDHENIPAPPNPSDDAYRREAIRHISRVASGPTHFISLSRNLMRCLHRALKSSHSSISVIDLHVLSSLGVVQSATSLKLEVNRDKYIPTGEYLVYGSIPASAIVSTAVTTRLVEVLGTVPDDPFGIEVLRAASSVMAARRIIYRDPLPMSHYAGAALGKLVHALHVPWCLMRDAVWSITTDFKFQEAQKWQENEVFCGGVESGYRARQSGKFLSLDIEEANGCTEVDQSDEESEQEVSPPSHDSIRDWKFEDSPESNDRQTYDDGFMAELYRAAEDASFDIEQTETNYPFTSALEIPVIKYEEEEMIADNAGDQDETLGGRFIDNQSGINIAYRPFAHAQIRGDIDGTPVQEPENGYDFCWTGM